MNSLIQRIRTVPDSEVFMHIMELSAQGQAAEQPALVLIQDDDPLVRSRGFCVLENIEGAIARNQSVLLANLNDVEMRNCKDLAKSLIYGDVPIDAIFTRCEQLAKSPKTQDIAASAYVAVCVGEVDSGLRDRCVPFVRNACRHRDVFVRRHGFQALEEALKVREKLVPEITDGITDVDPAIRVLAANHAGQVGAKAAVPALIEALTAEDPDLRCGAAWSLGHTGATGSRAIEPLAVALSDDDESVRINAADSLAKFGKHSKSAMPQMLKILSDPKLVTDLLVVAVWKIAPEKKELLTPLIELLNHGPEDLKTLAAEHLGKLGADAAPAIPALESAAHASTMGLDYAAKAALRRIERALKPRPEQS